MKKTIFLGIITFLLIPSFKKENLVDAVTYEVTLVNSATCQGVPG